MSLRRFAFALSTNPAYVRFGGGGVTSAPRIYSLSPTTGPSGGGTAVTIIGVGFTGATAVNFGANPATSLVVVDDNEITCVTPAGAGPVIVHVTTPGGTGDFGTAIAPGFTYAGGAPAITSLDFTLGDTDGGGQNVTITGTNFGALTGVTFGGTAATIVSQTSTTCVVQVPAHALGLVNIVATNAAGSSPPLVNGFEYWTPAQVTGIDAYLDSNKGVSLSLGAVTTWLDQSSNARSFTQGTGANRPSQPASVFGSLPSIRFSPQQWVGLASKVNLPSGLSAFMVAKWTSADASAAGAAFGNAPLGLINDDSGGVVNHCLGASADQLQYANNAGAWVTYNRGSGLNDGAARLLGWTHDSGTNDLKAYSGGAQLGTTIAGVTYQGPPFPAGYTVVGVDFLDEDGWDGDVGAVVIVQGVISGADLTKLNAWSRQRFGTP